MQKRILLTTTALLYIVAGLLTSPVSANTITTGSTSTAICVPAGVSVTYTVSGTYNAGNVFTAQLSNASGSFASPTSIGMLTSTASGTINATILSGTAAGTKYRIRVVSSNPVVTGSDNGSNIIISATPTINSVGNQTLCNGASTAAVNFSGTGLAFFWSNSAPSIGIPALGTGNIPSFIASNNGFAPVTAVITATPSSGIAYISNSGDNTVSVINTATNLVVGTIPVGTYPVGVAISPNGSMVYVVNEYDNTVSVILTSTNTVVATIPVGSFPYGVAVSPDGSKVYVTNDIDNTVCVIAAATNTVINTITVGDYPQGIAVSPDGSKVYVVNGNDNTISVINASSGSVTSTISVGTYPLGIAISPDGSTVYVANQYDNTVSVINAATNLVSSTIAVGGYPYGVAVSLDGSSVYVSDGSDGTISVINAATASVASTITVGDYPQGVAVSQDGISVYVANFDGTVSVINVATSSVSSPIAVGNSPMTLGVFVNGASCSATSVSFNITVNPSASAASNSPVCTGNAINLFSNSGTSYLWTGPNGFSSAIQNPVISNAPLASAGTYSVTVVTSACGTATTTTAVVLNQTPAVNAVANQTVYTGTSTAAVNFSGTGTIYTWTNDTPSIGLAASGTGNISSFTATNGGVLTKTATITVNALSGFAYIANSDAGTVSVINTNADSVFSTITVGSHPQGIAISPDGSKVYVSNNGSNNVSVINTSGGTVTSTIGVGSNPAGIAITPDGSKLYVACSGAKKVYVISTSSGTVTTIFGVGNNPTGVVISPDGSELFISNSGDGSITEYNITGGYIMNTIFNVGNGTDGLAISPDGNTLYVANNTDGTASFIDVGSSDVSTITVGTGPFGISASPDGNWVYVANQIDGTVSVINVASETVTSTITVGNNPTGVSISSDGTLLYVTNNIDGTVSVINTASGTISSTITVGSGPYSLGKFVAGSNCNGTRTFTITVNKLHTSTQSAAACFNYVWNGTTYTTSGTETYTTGDSTALLFLTINVSTSSSSSTTSCNSYVWNGTTYTTGGTYTWDAFAHSSHNAAGCDSVATLILTINHSSASSTTVGPVCNSYTWNGTTYTGNGTYTWDAFAHGSHNAAGCDSVATLILTINHSSTSSSSVTNCNSYAWNGTTYTISATYTWDALAHSSHNAAGCDSVASLILTITHSTTSSSSITNCDSYAWNGSTYTTGGTYTWDANAHGSHNAANCDSVATLTLTINHSSSSSSAMTNCNSYVWNGHTYTTSGTYSYDAGSTSNSHHCDSVANLILTINHSSTSSASLTNCNSYVWNGSTYTSSGTYTYDAGSMSNAGHCDSVATLHLTINYSSYSISSVTNCNIYVWNGSTLTTSGTYVYDAGSTSNAEQCDSLVGLYLTINYSSTSSTSVTNCNSYAWNGTTYTTSGTYTHDAGSTSNAAGCDSVATLHLTINLSTASSASVTNCNSYVWNGITYTTSGTYTYDAGSTSNAGHCDSVATLHLSINYSSASSASVTNCNSYAWNGITYTTGGTYTWDAIAHSSHNAAGCDSVATLHLTINYSSASNASITNCNSYAWNGITYTTSGTYTHDAGSTSNAVHCDSVATLNLTINHSSTSFTSVTVCNVYVWNGSTYTTGGTYTHDVGSTSNAQHCDSIATLQLSTSGPCQSILSLKIFIQGYYQNYGSTTPMDNNGGGGCLYASGVSSNPTEVDTIIISIENPNTHSQVGASVKGILHTNGTVWQNGSPGVTLPATVNGNSYYIKVNHRNAIQTWSGSPVLFSSATSYDFTSGNDQSFGDNMVSVDKINGKDVYAFWNGDVYDANNATPYAQDGVIESSDYGLIEEDYTSILFGYYTTDVTGDGVVESSDYSLIEENYTVIIFAATPW